MQYTCWYGKPCPILLIMYIIYYKQDIKKENADMRSDYGFHGIIYNLISLKDLLDLYTLIAYFVV